MFLPLSLFSSRVAFAVCALVLCASCSFGSSNTVDEPEFTDDLIGRPPDSNDDPFASSTLPPDAVEAAASGTIGDPEREPIEVLEPVDATPSVEAPAPPEREPVVEPVLPEPPLPEPVVEPVEPVVEALVEPTEPVVAAVEPPPERSQAPVPALVTEAEPEDVEAMPEPSNDLHRCFSCVKVCSASDPTTDCSASAEDIICGWGTSEELPDARKMARAECDATLDMAREMPRFSRIEGECPVASCR